MKMASWHQGEENETGTISYGQLVVEIAHSQRHAVIELVQQADLLTNPEVLKDHEDFWRVLVADRAE